MITKNQVYTKLKKAMPKIYMTQAYEVIPKEMPCLYFRESHQPMRRHINLDFTDKQIKMFCYIELYGKELDKYVTKVEEVMRSMFFIEELCQTLPNYDPSIERVSLRFQRIITESDEL